MSSETDIAMKTQETKADDLWARLLAHQELVFRICLGICRNSADADDQAQETYCKAFSRRAALAELPRRQRDALILREYGQLSYREISLLLGIKEGTLMSVLLRARRKVHRLVQEALHEKQ